MTRQIRIGVINGNQLNKRVIDFFKTYDFKLLENNDNFLKFRQTSSLFDGWKTNPIKWGSVISVSLSENNIVADFLVDTAAQMNTMEEEAVWQTFIERFQSYMTKGETDNSRLYSMIDESKKKRLSYFGWTILGALTGGFLAFIYSKLTNNNSTISLLIIPIMATTFLGWRINYVKTKNAL